MESAQPETGNLIVGRRPVFDAALEVCGYTLGVTGAEGEPAGRAGVLTAEAAARHAGRPDWERFCGAKQTFFKPSPGFFTGEEDLGLDPGRTVVRVEGERPGTAEACEWLVAAGWHLALDQPDRLDPSSPLLDLASFARIDFLELPSFGLRGLMERVRAHGLRPVALGVDDGAQLTLAGHAGFDLFEGRLLSRPLSAMPDALTPSRLAVLRMIETVNDPHTSAADLQQVVEADAGLSFRLLHVSSPVS